MSKALIVGNFFKNIIRKPYYYVPPCPKCGSKETGRVVQQHSESNSGWVEREALRNGELVAIAEGYDNQTAFCCECENIWIEPSIQLKFLPISQIEEEKAKRHTNEKLAEWNQSLNAQRTDFNKKHAIFGRIKDFIGPM